MERSYNIIIEKGEDDYYTSEVIGLDGCHTQAKSIDELIKRTKEAIELYLECEGLEEKKSSSFVAMQTLIIQHILDILMAEQLLFRNTQTKI